MNDIELLKNVGKQLSGKANCPDCKKEGKFDQPLYTIGDAEDNLFCPHCDLGIELNLTYRA
jgi:hypothetical protein